MLVINNTCDGYKALGRVLMQRFEAAKAKEPNRLPKTLFEIDYVLRKNSA